MALLCPAQSFPIPAFRYDMILRSNSGYGLTIRNGYKIRTITPSKQTKNTHNLKGDYLLNAVTNTSLTEFHNFTSRAHWQRCTKSDIKGFTHCGIGAIGEQHRLTLSSPIVSYSCVSVRTIFNHIKRQLDSKWGILILSHHWI